MNEFHRLSPFVPTAFSIALILAGLGRSLPLGSPAPWWVLGAMLGSGAVLVLIARRLDYEVMVYGSGLETSSASSQVALRRLWVRARRWATVSAVLIALIAMVSTGVAIPTITSVVWVCAVAVPTAWLLGVLSGVDEVRRLVTALTPWFAVAWAGGAPWTDAHVWSPTQGVTFGVFCAACILLAEYAARPLTNVFGRSVGRKIATGLIVIRVAVSLLAVWAVVVAGSTG
ncbi:hypothetical protein OVA21_13795 [Dietzia sp. SL131]|uniref:hypothetical protein n=1 Tax=Dietzia sp. SL131 TaxID=2995149 RepID=UPI00227B9ED1|nr:hypothetical protein [Dietzia sp. SL131]MCY1658258.1 hypothetical protein [Dietzia sp. SL131]